MPTKMLTAELPAKDFVALKKCFADIRQLLPFLRTLEKAERQRLYKAGQKSLTFLQDVQTAVRNHPEILPPTFDRAVFERDLGFFTMLCELCTCAQQLAADLTDTKLALGSDTIRAGTKAYRYVKEAAKHVPGLKTVEDQLRPRFARPRKKKMVALSKAS